MTELTLKIPYDIPHLLKMSTDDFTREAQMLLAVKLFEMGRLTSGKAAELAGMPRVAFLHTLSRYGVAAINIQAEEIDHEIDAGKRLAG
jgi:predicted HTH domain antitoxin